MMVTVQTPFILKPLQGIPQWREGYVSISNGGARDLDRRGYVTKGIHCICECGKMPLEVS